MVCYCLSPHLSTCTRHHMHPDHLSCMKFTATVTHPNMQGRTDPALSHNMIVGNRQYVALQPAALQPAALQPAALQPAALQPAAGFFIKDLDDSSVMEDEEMFEGRRTFPEEKSHDTNQFIIRYIREKFPDCNVGYHGHAPYCHEEKGDKQIYTAGCDVKIILSGLKMKHKTSYRFSSAGETECYWDHDGFGCISYPGEDGMTHNMVLRGGRFEELDEIMKILFE